MRYGYYCPKCGNLSKAGATSCVYCEEKYGKDIRLQRMSEEQAATIRITNHMENSE